MPLEIYKLYDGLGVATVLIALAIMLLAGFALSRLTKLLKLPNVTGYIIAGVLIGPYVLNMIPGEIIDSMSFLSDLALGFIAFGVGKFFKKNVIKSAGLKIIVITLFEALLAGILVTVFVGVCFPSLGWSFALLLGAIATATAPASTMMTINQYKAKGDFVNTLLQVVALDDIVCLLVFSVVSAIISGTNGEGVDIWSIILPILYNIAFIVVGFISGFILGFLVKKRSPNSRLIIAVALICAISGACIVLNISPLLSCMVFGATYINFKEDEKIFKYMDHFTPPIMLLFFVMSGMNMNLTAFATVGLVGVVYFIVRIVGKYGGAYLGCLVTKKAPAVKNYLGFALIPQAGVAIGLAFLGQRMLPAEIGSTFLSIILCSSVLYEMAGPILAKFALFKSGAISKDQVPVLDTSEVIDSGNTYQRINVKQIEQINGVNSPTSKPIEDESTPVSNELVHSKKGWFYELLYNYFTC